MSSTKHCLLIQIIESSDSKKTREQAILPGSKPCAIRKMRNAIAMPGEFFYELATKDCAKIIRGSTTIGYSLVEYPSLEAAKLMMVTTDADQ